MFHNPIMSFSSPPTDGASFTRKNTKKPGNDASSALSLSLFFCTYVERRRRRLRDHDRIQGRARQLDLRKLRVAIAEAHHRRTSRGEPGEPRHGLIQKLFDIYDRYDYADEETGLTHLHVACMSAALTPYAAMFLNLGQSNPNCPVRDTGDTPLHYAARHRNQEAVSLLLRHGAEPTRANYEGLSPLHLLCQVDDDDDDDGGDHARLREFFRVCEDVVEKPLYLDPRDIRGNTPLHVALRSGSKRAAKLMLAKGADPLLPNEENLTPLQMAIDLGDRDFAQTFYEICVEQGRIDDPNLANNNKNINNDNNNDEKEDIFFKIDEVNRKRLESLHVAIVSHDMILVDRLVKEGANPNARDSMGRTPLHVICQVDGNGASSSLIESLAQLFFETCDEVKQQQLEIDARDVDGLTPLQWAVARLLPETVELLLQRGADLANFVFPPREAVFYDEVRGSDYCDVEALAEIAASRRCITWSSTATAAAPG
ncbi:unnamed protein product [Trichogramma brassicae]|uniref:Uncharacterized protein n=1 Tax=Trichogramma brassicae TaxID=86971 RepID=A0A6H5IMH1_9HYME|nr:unnamed protein product [Trichogramma brassicae]